jgi:tRNA A-37 threonylcarbamoyl transferase component Bud32
MQPRTDAQPFRSLKTVYRPSAPHGGGWFETNPAFAEAFSGLGLDSAQGFLDLPGEVVSGHPDRHVAKVRLPGLPAAFYLKRQHVVRRWEKLRNWRAGFGWTSRSVREKVVLEQLNRLDLPAPRWAAVGEDERGRAFLLVEEFSGAIDLRERLSDPDLSTANRRALADLVGRSVAQVHAAGVTTPELAAKHVLVAPGDSRLSLIDWQFSRRLPVVPLEERLRSLAILHATVAPSLASERERLRVLWAALRFGRKVGLAPGRFSVLVRRVVEESRKVANRRSIRDQRHGPSPTAQRLVWLAGEKVCAVPDVAEHWPEPAVGPPFYDQPPGVETLRMPDGRAAVLIRGRSIAPWGRLRAWLRGRSWRSLGVTLGRLAFHLERYGIPAPRLLAFGQRMNGLAATDWFIVHTPSASLILECVSSEEAGRLGQLLRRLHDAGCSLTGDPLLTFGRGSGGFCVRELAGVLIREPNAERELSLLVKIFPEAVRAAAIAGYRADPEVQPRSESRITPQIQRVDAIS